MGEEVMMDQHQEEAEHYWLYWPEKNLTQGYMTAWLMVGPVLVGSFKFDVFSVLFQGFYNARRAAFSVQIIYWAHPGVSPHGLYSGPCRDSLSSADLSSLPAPMASPMGEGSVWDHEKGLAALFSTRS